MRSLKLLIIILLLMLLIGCSSTGKPLYTQKVDIASDVNDEQYCFYKEVMYSSMTDTNDGYYFFSGPGDSYLFYMDKNSLKSTILCNKPECMHMNKKDPEKVSDCNAFFSESNTNLMYYNNYLYSMQRNYTKNGEVDSLLKISTDGTERDEIFQFKYQPQCIAIHRGYLYYVVNDHGTVEGKEDTTFDKNFIYCIPMEHLDSEPEIVYEKDGIYASVGGMICYENTLFFTFSSFTDSKLKEKYANIECYDISSKSSRIISENAGRFAICSSSKIIFYSKGLNYICDLDGGNKHKLDSVIGLPYSDDTYIVTDTVFLTRNNANDSRGNLIKPSLNIYDMSGKLLQTFDTSSNVEYNILGSNSDFIFLKDYHSQNQYGPCSVLWSIDKQRLKDGKAEMKMVYKFIPEIQFPGVVTKNDGQ